MGNKTTAQRDTEIVIAAGIFALQTRDAKQIADTLKTTERTVHRWAETDTWKQTLVTLNYEGDRSFRVNRAGRKKQNKK